jgi:hypothetical protein
MSPIQLQEIFGTEPGRIYSFTGSVPEGSDPVEHITEEFATAAGSSLIDCVVTQLSGSRLVYTRNTEVTSDTFRLIVELPLPEPEPEVVETPTESTPTEETP